MNRKFRIRYAGDYHTHNSITGAKEIQHQWKIQSSFIGLIWIDEIMLFGSIDYAEGVLAKYRKFNS